MSDDIKIENVKKERYMSWETYFMSVAILSSFRSKDKHTSNGACIVNSDKRIISIGYNGMPNGIDENNPRYWNDNDNDIENSRHTYIVHAEKNAILNGNGVNLKGTTIYTSQFPCNICAQAIIQVGIKKVVYLNKKENTEEHKKRNKAVMNMFNSCGIKVMDYNDFKIKDKDFINMLLEINPKLYSSTNPNLENWNLKTEKRLNSRPRKIVIKRYKKKKKGFFESLF